MLKYFMRKLTDEERNLRLIARAEVKRAISHGVLQRPGACEECGAYSGTGCGGTWNIPEAHHDDYTKPLAVRWLCHWCHRSADKAVRRKAKQKLMAKLARTEVRCKRKREHDERYNGFATLRDWKRATFSSSHPVPQG